MEETNKKVQYNLLAGIAFAILAVRQLYFIVRYSYFSIWSYLLLIGFIVIAVVSFIGKKDIVCTSAILFFSLVEFVYSIVCLGGYYIVGDIIYIVTFAAFAWIAAVETIEGLSQYKDSVKKLWFLPAALYLASSVLSVFSYLVFNIFRLYLVELLGIANFTDFIFDLIFSAGLFFTSMWLVFPEGLPQSRTATGGSANDGASNAYAPNTASSTNGTEQDAYCGLVKHILLLLFTCGIWYLIWIYKVTAYLNCVKDEEERNPTTKLLLCMFIPFYSIYWVYKSAQRIDKLAKQKGVESDLSTLCLILAIFVSIIPPILMQDKINAICTHKDETPYVQPESQPQPSAQPVQHNSDLGVADELLKFKELLDAGVITQEEFDAKKKQLLGL